VANSGKSTITDIIRRIIGDEQIAAFSATLAGRFDLAQAINKKLMLFPETPDGDQHTFHPFWADIIKGVTGGDLSTIERKNREPYSAQLKIEIMTVGNNPPIMKMDREAFRRRSVFISTVRPVAYDDQQAKESMITRELPGIFIWGLVGAAALWRGQRIETPQACQRDLDDVTMDTDPATAFVDNMVAKAGVTSYVSIADMYTAFQEYCIVHRYKPSDSSKIKLGRLIRHKYDAQMEDKRVNGKTIRIFVGVRLVTPSAAPI
jgi:Predicted ATPase